MLAEFLGPFLLTVVLVCISVFCFFSPACELTPPFFFRVCPHQAKVPELAVTGTEKGHLVPVCSTELYFKGEPRYLVKQKGLRAGPLDKHTFLRKHGHSYTLTCAGRPRLHPPGQFRSDRAAVQTHNENHALHMKPRWPDKQWSL